MQLEEQQRRLDRGLLLLGVGEQRAALRVGRVGGEVQRGEVAAASRQLLDLGQLPHGGGEPVAVEPLQAPRVALGERSGALEGFRQSLPGTLLALPVDQLLEVPRRRLELLVTGIAASARRHRSTAQLSFPPGPPTRSSSRR